ncbi:MAG: D-2-hydroxyacid dehydrogenase [Myxococcales bacterium]|nr:MAG: D-2-hydroxyacid dehydrogenase [Myxococcales bacterium]
MSERVYVDLPAGSAPAEAFARALAGERGVTFRPGDDGDERRRLLADATVVVTRQLSDEDVAAATSLRWLAFLGAGVDQAATPAVVARAREGVVVTTASGVHGPNIAEQVMGWMLAFTRDFPGFWRSQAAFRWDRVPPDGGGRLAELAGQTLGIVGLGSIGAALALRARAFDMKVLGLVRRPDRTVEGVDRLLGPDGLDELLAASDHVCLIVPLTPDTRGLIDAGRLAKMKPTAYLYNVARGAVVDQDALIAALGSGQLAGAGLDVFVDEPLPPDNPLWSLPSVLLTPHIAGSTPRYYERAAGLLVANLARWRAGEPLARRYDPDRGY